MRYIKIIEIIKIFFRTLGRDIAARLEYFRAANSLGPISAGKTPCNEAVNNYEISFYDRLIAIGK